MKRFLLLVCLVMVSSALRAEESGSSWKDLLIDPEDGMLDASAFLGTAKGFLPLGTLITEPTVGYGAAMGLMFLHDSFDNRAELIRSGQAERLSPPGVSGLFGGATENGTWFAGAAHAGFWKDDRIRYLGAGGFVDAQLDFYGLPSIPQLPVETLSYQLEGAFLLQQFLFRMGGSDLFLGFKLQGSRMETRFSGDIVDTIDPAVPLERSFQNVAAGAVLQWDRRDNIFSTNEGTDLKLELLSYMEALGGDRDFLRLNSHVHHWMRLGAKHVLGLRASYQRSEAGTPFYMLPFVDLRGIPAMRYQGEQVSVLESELRWDVNHRWSLVGFAGAGWASSDELDDLVDAQARPAGGLGFRYLIAKTYDIRTGMDFAWGEEDFAFYFTTGSGW